MGKRITIITFISMILTLAAAGLCYAEDSAIKTEISGNNVSEVYTSDVTVSYEASDAEGIKDVSLYYGSDIIKIDSKNLSKTYESAKEAKGSFTLTESWLKEKEKKGNEYEVKLIVTDAEDNKVGKDIKFSADVSAPQVTVSGVENEKYYNDSRVLSVTVTDNCMDNVKGTLTLAKDGKTIDSKTSISDINGYKKITTDEGTYTLSINAEGPATKTICQFVFTVDETEPVLSEITATGEKSGNWFTGAVTLTGSISDELSGIKDKKIYVNGTDMTSSASFTKDGYTLVLSKEWIKNCKKNVLNIEVKAEDNASNSASQSSSIDADVVCPTFTIKGITDKAIIKTPPHIAITLSDDTDDGTIHVTLKNGDNAVIDQDYEKTASFDVSEEGSYTLKVSAKDKAGNKAADTQLSFVLDMTAPAVSDILLSGSKSEKDWYNGDVTISGTAVDELSAVKTKKITVNGTDVTGDTDFEKDSYTYTLNKNQIEKSGTNDFTVKVSFTDESGNTETKERSFKADVINPEVSISGIEDGDIINTSPVVTSTLSDDSGQGEVITKVYWDGTLVKTIETENKTQYSVTEDGEYRIVSQAIDNAENTSEEKTVTFKRDTVNPEIQDIEISGEKKSGYEWFCNGVNVSNDYSDDFSGIDSVKITVNGENFVSENKESALTAEADFDISRSWFESHESDDGKYTVKTVVKDMAGNTSEKAESFYCDIETPKISISGIANGTYTAGTPEIKAEVTDNYAEKNTITFKVYKNGSLYKTIEREGSEGQISVFDKDGNYKVTVYSADKAGNKSSEKSLSFVKDTTAPKVSISGAKNGAYISSTVKLAIHIVEKNYANQKVSVKMTRKNSGSKAAGMSFAIKPNKENFTATKKISAAGTYSIEVSSTDKAGNKSAVKKLSFTVDQSAPVIKIKAPDAENGAKDTVAPVITVTDDYYGTMSVDLSKTGERPSGLTFTTTRKSNGATRTYANFRKKKCNDGAYTLSVAATDKAGNRSTDTITFKVNRYGSTFTLGDSAESFNRQYMKKINRPVVITEKNLTGLKSKDVIIKKDGVEVESKFTVSNKTLKGYQYYDYSIKPESFTEDGVYEINIKSTDTVGNKSEFAKSKTDFKMYIDNTEPQISVSGIKEGKVYKPGSSTGSLQASDNLGLKTYRVTCGTTILTEKAEDLSVNEEASFTVPEGTDQDITVKVIDKAGNVSQETISDVTVSGNILTRIFSNGIILIILALAVLAAAAVLIIRVAKKKKND